ncbi:sensor histidine kinase [Ignavigranum ruoffiae]|uniref:sensor histidine kinase n=1 Tax=Ignavigranum ruoffiae TaxID=89093 RepID=UPI0024ADCA08|nr:GHKL domain-containing protein [Ignavigranum ruoffiae]
MNQTYLQALEKAVHDYRKHLIAVLILLEAGEFQQGQHYLQDILEDWDESLARGRQQTGHPILDGLLQRFQVQANRQQIDFKASVSLDQGLPITDQELVAILMNLWDNAFEACCQQATNRLIELKFTASEYQWDLQMLNSYHYSKHHPGLESQATEKSPLARPGRGLGIVQDIVKRYHGHYQVQWNSQYFIFQIDINQ